jgi:hypothetical protein
MHAELAITFKISFSNIIGRFPLRKPADCLIIPGYALDMD